MYLKLSGRYFKSMAMEYSAGKLSSVPSVGDYGQNTCPMRRD